MTTTTTTSPRALPWLQYSAVVDAQIAAGIARNANRQPVGVTGSVPRQETRVSAPVSTSTPTVNGASDKQKNLIDALLTEKVHSYTEAEVIVAKADWRETRKMIDFLIAAPRQPRQAPVQVEAPELAPVRDRLDFSAILDGNYAIPGDDEDEIKFYRVSRNTSADGRVWTNVQARASDDLYRIPFRAGIAVLHKIVAYGLEESQMLFAAKLERCWKCGRSLTDKLSRERGQGPDCWEK